MNKGALAERKLRVGVTLHIRDEAQSIWENGIFQNCAFLVQTLEASPWVESAFLVFDKADDFEIPKGLMLDLPHLRLMNLTQAMQHLDVVVEMSAQLPEDWVNGFASRGGQYVWMRVGNDYVIDIERAMHGKPHAGLISKRRYDAVWTIPEYERSCFDYFALTARSPVRIVPHIWSPEFFERGISTLPSGVSYGYKPGRQRWRLCSFEPNVCMVKTSVIPMLACEEAYRRRPDMVDLVRVCNTFHLKEHPALRELANALDIVKHGVASFEGRFAVYEFMAHFGDCIVSHHWENGQNYLYYEALYGGYPLVHNSEFIRDQGYFYPAFDTQAAGAAVVQAYLNHDANLPAYKQRAARCLEALLPRNAANVQAYSDELLRLFA